MFLLKNKKFYVIDKVILQYYNTLRKLSNKGVFSQINIARDIMSKQVKVKTVSNLSNNSFLGLMFIVLGIFFIMGAQSIMNILFTVIGSILLVLGATELFEMNWIVGAIELALGIIIIICGNLVLEYLLLILGIFVLAYGVFLLVTSIIKNSKSGAAAIIFSLIPPLLLLTIGILLILDFCNVASLFIVIGAIAIAVGAFLVLYDLIKKLISNAKKK